MVRNKKEPSYVLKLPNYSILGCNKALEEKFFEKNFEKKNFFLKKFFFFKKKLGCPNEGPKSAKKPERSSKVGSENAPRFEKTVDSD